MWRGQIMTMLVRTRRGNVGLPRRSVRVRAMRRVAGKKIVAALDEDDDAGVFDGLTRFRGQLRCRDQLPTNKEINSKGVNPSYERHLCSGESVQNINSAAEAIGGVSGVNSSQRLRQSLFSSTHIQRIPIYLISSNRAVETSYVLTVLIWTA